MKIKMGDKEAIIESKTVKPFEKNGEIYAVDCVRVYAQYVNRKRNLYSNNYIDIPIQEEMFDLEKAIRNFSFEHKKYTNSSIIGYQFYYVNKKWSLTVDIHKKVVFYDIESKDFKYNK